MRGEFFFDPSWELFEKHFPGKAVVPGSLIIGYFLQKAGELSSLKQKKIRIKKFRFLDFVSPGRYCYEMEYTQGSILCKLWKGDRLMCDGVIQIG